MKYDFLASAHSLHLCFRQIKLEQTKSWPSPWLLQTFYAKEVELIKERGTRTSSYIIQHEERNILAVKWTQDC